MRGGGNSKIAFTLAEVLITIGIVGVVVAMVLPGQIVSYQKKAVESALKKSYSDLNNILIRAQINEGSLKEWDMPNEGVEKWVKKYIEPYVNVTASGNCTNNVKQRCINIPSLRTLGASNSPRANYHYALVLNGGAIKALGFYTYYPTYPEIRCYVFLNIPKKTSATRGKDVFTFVLNLNDAAPSFKPFGMPGTVPFTSKDKPTRDMLLHGPIRTGGCFATSGAPDYYGPGDGCGAVIMLDNWQIKNDYPW